MKNFSCNDAKGIDLVEYMAALNYHPPKSFRGHDYWYCSPLPGGNGKTPSFKVDLKKNLWYDHGIGKGGDIIDFGTTFHCCSVSEFLQILSNFRQNVSLSFASSTFSDNVPIGKSCFAGEKKENGDEKIVLVYTRPLATKQLISYLQRRCISLEVAGNYCKRVDFLLYGKLNTVIGFENNSGGFELRNENFKGSSSPKDIRLLDNKFENLAVFEGFFLSFHLLPFMKVKSSQCQIVLSKGPFLSLKRAAN